MSWRLRHEGSPQPVPQPLSSEQIVEELQAAGFAADAALPLRELNRPAGLLRTESGPVIYEGLFRFIS